MTGATWYGDSWFLLRQLVLKDFRIRYRNMSLGIFWSVLQPLVLVTLMTYVFTVVLNNATPHFSVLVLTGLLPYNFFALSWSSATDSLVQNASLVKRVPVQRALVPVACVFSNVPHLGIQFLILMAFLLYQRIPINLYWLWLPVLYLLEVLCLVGLGLLSAAANVLIRDIRYVVESANLVLFWLVPIAYPIDLVPKWAREFYYLNPVAALVVGSRNVILEHAAPAFSTVWKLALVAAVMLAVGIVTFRLLSRRFYAYL